MQMNHVLHLWGKGAKKKLISVIEKLRGFFWLAKPFQWWWAVGGQGKPPNLKRKPWRENCSRSIERKFP